ncbi:MAG: VOC family protein [Pseudobdellovibrio sp.]
MNINTYLTFNGNCADAMKFYQKCLKGELNMMPFSEIPGQQIPPGSQNRIMHARLQIGSAILMASDTMPEHPFKQGNNFSISLACTSKAQVDELANALKEGGMVTMPNQDTFWGAYFGMVTDKFGIQWMFNYDLPKT